MPKCIRCILTRQCFILYGIDLDSYDRPELDFIKTILFKFKINK